jgi:hypothetical protein
MLRSAPLPPYPASREPDVGSSVTAILGGFNVMIQVPPLYRRSVSGDEESVYDGARRI